MPRVKKPVAANRQPPGTGDPERCLEQSSAPNPGGVLSCARARTSKPTQKKRGWRDIEGLKERERLKNMITDIWHEDLELDEDIFGETDGMAGYYSSSREELTEIEIEVDADDDDYEDFEEKD